MSCSSCGQDSCACNSGFKFRAGEDLDLYFHLTKTNPVTGLTSSLDLTPYQTPPATIEIQLPGIAVLQEAEIVGLPQDGNIHLSFGQALTEVAGTGFPLIILTDAGGLVRKVLSSWQITNVG